jgi:hypothetical protein
MFGVDANTLAGAAGVFSLLTYLLFFLLLLSANIALWKYILMGRMHRHSEEKEVDKKERR